VAVLAVVLAKVGAILNEVQMSINDVRKETMPLLKEVRTTVVTLNVEMDRVDGIMASAESAASSVSNVAKLVTAATANPIIKAMAFLTGAGVSVRALRRKHKDTEDE
jgi:ABC-type transporter Mla subunit MlaD